MAGEVESAIENGEIKMENRNTEQESFDDEPKASGAVERRNGRFEVRVGSAVGNASAAILAKKSPQFSSMTE